MEGINFITVLLVATIAILALQICELSVLRFKGRRTKEEILKEINRGIK